MHRTLMAAFIVGGIASAVRAQTAPTPSPFDAALRKAGLGVADIRIARTDLDRLTNRAPPGSVLAHLFAEPLQCKAFMQQVRGDLLEDLTVPAPTELTSAFWHGIDGIPAKATWTGSTLGLADTIGKLTRWGDRVVRRTLLGNPVAADLTEAAAPNALFDAIAAIHERAGRPLQGEPKERLTTQLRRVPTSAARAAALVLRVANRAIAARDRAIRHLDRAGLAKLERIHDQLSLPEDGDSAAFRDRLAGFELGHMLAAAQELAAASHLAARLLALAPPADVDLSWDTPCGRIRINGTGDTTYEDDVPYLLILDLAGDDTYHAGGGACGLDVPVSVLIDVRGNDRYVARHDPLTPVAASQPAATRPSAPAQVVPCAFGAGILGIGLLVDCAGNDSYDVSEAGLGYALFGVGILDDWAGDDQFAGVSETEASATAGLALLVDRAGADRYMAYTASQAFAGVQGIAALIDLAGNDRYTANDEDIRFPSAQSPKHNNSMCQAAAVGNRADYLDGYSLPGGIAILLDAAGDDQYTCGVFGQGTGYWLGAGFLMDAAGNDTYFGQWYVQGAAAHFALGALLDEAGDDRYEAQMATSQGTGHDMSVGFLADLAGNDRYRSGGLTMGAGNDAGIGLAFDLSGDDDYQIGPDATLGYANAPQGVRASMPCIGIFLDGGGKDHYSQSYATDAGSWGIGPGRALQRTSAARYGIGLDTTLTPQQMNALWRRGRSR